MRNQQPPRQFRARSRSRSRNRSRNRSRFASKFVPAQYKDVLVVKTENILGITVSDNVNGMVYIRRIRPNTICAQMQDQIHVGDQIEKVNGESMIGKRHFQVARLLRGIPVGQIITLGLISNEENVTSPIITSPVRASTPIKPVTEMKIVEITKESTVVEQVKQEVVSVPEEAPNKKLIECINKVFEEYLGFDDDDLALSIWKLASNCTNLFEMSAKIRESPELSQFEFPEDLIFDMWGIVDDFKHKRLSGTESQQKQDVHFTGTNN